MVTAGAVRPFIVAHPALAFAERGSGATRLEASHDGYASRFGLIHRRILMLRDDGTELRGEDLLVPTKGKGGRGKVAFAIRFHLHPDVEASIDMGGSAVSLALKSGEIWVFRHDGAAKLTLEPSVYLEKGRLQPRATKQIVLSGLMAGFETRIGWTLAKAQDTPLAIRDLDREELPVPI